MHAALRCSHTYFRKQFDKRCLQNLRVLGGANYYLINHFIGRYTNQPSLRNINKWNFRNYLRHAIDILNLSGNTP